MSEVSVPARLLERLRQARTGDALRHVRRIPPRPGRVGEWPAWTPVELREALAATGVAEPWTHQVAAAEAAHRGEHVVVATGTASGKTLAYQLPTLSALLEDESACALYLSPTKALAADQMRSLGELGLTSVVAAVYDGDTPYEQREWLRRHARMLLSNPDMVHHGMLPRHERWGRFLRRLKYVIVDECHTYRGVFGSHVALLLRRLRRVAAIYGADPVFLLASATTGDPAYTASRLVGAPVTAVTDDGSPRAGTTFALWEPPMLPDITGEGGAPVRKSTLSETSDLLTDLVVSGTRTVAFVGSRRGAEFVAQMTRRGLSDVDPDLPDRVAAYRAGYLREERRELEERLREGDILGLAATNALELGVDIAGLDAVVLAGYPGTLASVWQQAGRAGRAGREALAVLVARDDPLDTYLVHHPEAIFDRPVEATVLDPANPYVLAPHLARAATEAHLTEEDVELFGGEPARRALEFLVADGLLRRRRAGWFWTRHDRPDVSLRGTGGEPVAVVETETGQLLGTVDAASAPFLTHPGAVYPHQGRTYLVDALDLDDAVAMVTPANPDWTTHPRDVTDLEVLSVTRRVDAGPVAAYLGEVDVTGQVTSYQRRRLPSGQIIDETPLDLPARSLRTVAVWWTIAPSALIDAGLAKPDFPGSLHAAEHAAIGLLPLVATCDRWDVGGLSTALHPDTGTPTIFVYDGHPGGAGFAERGFEAVRAWLTATRDAIRACECSSGCPSCVQSPKCGNGNEPLDKPGALVVLGVLLRSLPA
ncbi:helicase [Actinorhabdospora filicis]|uniref:Helicase n=1 Tax=Actinorhabdospora filicis TaxID=1785913 RepID=A0A9W6SQW3_9ACTN|nr:DEAD/DEAH box helicase [Actinorhabdospora filicis]GLZ80458.1 helicase [Actinorhabdospora filicis]